jgi:hypothetical protein
MTNYQEIRTIIASLLRHGLTALGLMGTVSDEQLGQIAGAIAIVLGLAWSWWQKRQAARALNAAEEVV